MDVAVGQTEEAPDLPVVEVTIDPTDIRWIGVPSAEALQQVAHLVVGIGECLQHQGHIALAVERVEVRPEQHVDALAGEGGADVQKRASAETTEFGCLNRGCRIRRFHSVGHHPDGDVHAGVSQHIADELRHHTHPVEVGVEVGDHRLGDAALLPAEVLTGDPARGVDHPRRVHLADDHIRKRHLLRPTQQGGGLGVPGEVRSAPAGSRRVLRWRRWTRPGRATGPAPGPDAGS